MQRNQKGQFVKRTTGLLFEGFGVWLDHKGYPIVHIGGKDIKVHLYVWERVNGPKPQGFDIHHKDHDKANYQLDNLELLTISDHQRIHAGWIRENGIWIAKPCSGCHRVLPLDAFYARRTAKTPSALCKPCTNQATSTRNASPEYKDKRRLYNQRWYSKVRKEGVMPNASK